MIHIPDHVSQGVAAATGTEYEVRELQLSRPADVRALFELWDAVYPGVLQPKFSWLYCNNPVGLARVWAIVSGNGTIAGAAAVFPRRFRIDGTPHLAGLAGDFLIHPAHRVLGPAMKLQRTVCAAATNGWVEFLYGFPNVSAEAMFRRIGFQPLTPRARWVIPVRTNDSFARLRRSRYWAPLVAPIANQGLRIARWYLDRTPGISYRVSTSIDQRFEDIWGAIRDRSRIALDRTVEYLRWRYADAPVTPYTTVEALGRDGQLLGYAVTRIVDVGAEVCELVGADQETRRGLAGELWRMAHAGGAQRLECFVGTGTGSAAMLANTGFVERADAHRVLLYLPPNVAAKDVLLDPANWWLVQSDADI